MSSSLQRSSCSPHPLPPLFVYLLQEVNALLINGRSGLTCHWKDILKTSTQKLQTGFSNPVYLALLVNKHKNNNYGTIWFSVLPLSLYY